MKLVLTSVAVVVAVVVVVSSLTQESYAPYRSWKWSIPVDGEIVAESEVVSSESGN